MNRELMVRDRGGGWSYRKGSTIVDQYIKLISRRELLTYLNLERKNKLNRQRNLIK